LNTPIKNNNIDPAITVFNNVSDIQRSFTQKLFLLPSYTSRPVDISTETFVEGYTKEFIANSYGSIFNGYYDFSNPEMIDSNSLPAMIYSSKKEIGKLFDHQAVDMAYRLNLLENDIDVLKQISSQEIKIKWFQYDGNKYFYRKADAFIEQLETEAKELKKNISVHDAEIYSFFYDLASKQGKEEELKRLYKIFQDVLHAFKQKNGVYVDLGKETGFMSEVLEFRQIEANLTTVYRLEKPFKKEIEDILVNPLFESVLNQEAKDVFSKYLSQDWSYFDANIYNEKALAVFFDGLRNYQYILSQLIFTHKKKLLDYKAGLMGA
jgi:hypothetical protein